jgi:hypothetical protein
MFFSVIFQLLHMMHFLFTIRKNYKTTEVTEGFSVFSKKDYEFRIQESE